MFYLKKEIENIGIIGSGIVGLSMANILCDRYPNSKIQITSNASDEMTTSWGAPGFVRLNTNENKHQDKSKWFENSLKYYWELFRSAQCVDAGVSISNFYYISDKPVTLPVNYQDMFPGYREVNSKELAAIGFSSEMSYGLTFISPMIESRYYLRYLTDKFKRKGGKMITGKILNGKQNVADWAIKNNYDIVFNCSGLGSRELFDDPEIMPLRGHLVRVEAPWFKHSFSTEETDLTYAYSCRESVVLGGFTQLNDWDLTIRPVETKNILERIKRHNLCLGESKIIEEWVGLRPWRNDVRVELENIQSSDGKNITVVHNYGHGSSGIGLSWGTSLQAADLIDCNTDRNVQAKL